MSNDVGTLIVTMAMDAAPYVAGTKRVAAETTAMQGRISRGASLIKGALAGMFAAFSVDMFINQAKQALDYASSLGEVSQQIGITTDEYQALSYAATQVGLAQDDLESGMTKLTRTIGQAVEGNKKQVELFQKLGINIRDANGHVRTAGDILPDLAESLGRLGSDAERFSVGQELMGRGFAKFNPLIREGADGIRRYREEAQKGGMILTPQQIAEADAAADAIARFNRTLDMRFNSAIASRSGEIEKMANALGEVADRVSYLVGQTERLNRAGGGGVGGWLLNSLAASPAGMTVRTARRAWETNGDPFGIWGANNPFGQVQPQPTRRATPAPSAARPAGNRPASGGALLIDPRFRGVRNFIDDLSDQAINGAPAITTAIATIDRQVTQLATTMTNADPAVQSLMDRLFPVEQRQRQLAEEIALINRSTLATEQKARAIAALRREYGAFGEGITDWRDVIGDVGGDVDAEMARVQDVLGTVVDGWADAASGVEAQNVRIVESTAQMAQNALREIDGLARSIKSGDILGILSGVLGALDQIGGLTPGGFNFLGMQFGGARASGGPVRAGSTYLVGERGPELFRAGASGAITPNHMLGGAGGQTIQINVNAQGAVLAGQVEAMVAAGIEIATQRGAAMGATMARTRMIRDNSRVPA